MGQADRTGARPGALGHCPPPAKNTRSVLSWSAERTPFVSPPPRLPRAEEFSAQGRGRSWAWSPGGSQGPGAEFYFTRGLRAPPDHEPARPYLVGGHRRFSECVEGAATGVPGAAHSRGHVASELTDAISWPDHCDPPVEDQSRHHLRRPVMGAGAGPGRAHRASAPASRGRALVGRPVRWSPPWPGRIAPGAEA